MFLINLSEKEKQAFLGLAYAFLEVDGNIGSSEEIMLNIMKDEMGLDRETKPIKREILDNISVFTNRKSKAYVLLELIGLGYADANYCAAESEFISSIAEKLGFDKIEIISMENWVLRQLNLVKETEELFQERE